MVKKIYNVIFMSVIGNGTNTVGETFFYDWTQIPDVPYKVTFSFVSGIATLTNTQIATIFIDISQSNNQVATSQNTLNAQNRGAFLGSLVYSGTGASNYLSANITTNPPTFLNGRPRTNNVFIEIHQNTATLQSNYTPVTGAYTLILSFEEL